MRTLVRLGVVLAILMLSTLFVVLNSSSAAACSCAHRPLEEAVIASDSVIKAKIVSMETVSMTRKVNLEVVEAFKGEINERVVVNTPVSSATCGWQPEAGREYIIFLADKEPVFSTHLCAGNEIATEELTAELTALTSGGEIHQEVPEPDIDLSDEMDSGIKSAGDLDESINFGTIFNIAIITLGAMFFFGGIIAAIVRSRMKKN